MNLNSPRTSLTVLVLGVLTAGSRAQAPVTISHNNVSFTIRNYSGIDPDHACDFLVDGIDHMRSIPIFWSGGDFVGQKPLFKLIGSEVDPAAKPRWCRFYYEQQFFDKGQNYNFKVGIVVSYKISDTTLFKGVVDSGTLEVQVQARTNNFQGLYNRLRLFAVNDPTLNDKPFLMRADLLKNDPLVQLAAAPANGGRPAMMVWSTSSIQHSWEIGAYNTVVDRLKGATIFALPNGLVPFGPGTYTGSRCFRPTINQLYRPVINMKFTVNRLPKVGG